MAIYSSTDIQSASQQGGPLAGLRNLLINGAPLVAQRTVFNGTVGANSRIYGLFDRWVIGVSAGGTWGTAFTTNDNRNAMLFNCTGVSSWSVGQVIEYTSAWHLSGKTVTLSGWIKAASAFTATTGLEWYDSGTDSTPSGAGPTVTDTVSVTTDWTYFSSTFTVPTAPPLANYSINWGLSLGFSDLTDNIQLELQDIQLEQGPVATPFEQRPIGLELSLCQRYFYEIGTGVGMPGFYFNATGGTAIGVYLPVTTAMRIAPSIESGMTQTFQTDYVNGLTPVSSIRPLTWQSQLIGQTPFFFALESTSAVGLQVTTTLGAGDIGITAEL